MAFLVNHRSVTKKKNTATLKATMRGEHPFRRHQFKKGRVRSLFDLGPIDDNFAHDGALLVVANLGDKLHDGLETDRPTRELCAFQIDRHTPGHFRG